MLYALVTDTDMNLLYPPAIMGRLHPILLPFSGLLWGEFKSVPLLSHTNRQLSECFIDSTIPLHRIICIDFNTVSRCLSTPFLQKKYARGNCSSCTRVQRIVILICFLHFQHPFCKNFIWKDDTTKSLTWQCFRVKLHLKIYIKYSLCYTIFKTKHIGCSFHFQNAECRPEMKTYPLHYR